MQGLCLCRVIAFQVETHITCVSNSLTQPEIACMGITMSGLRSHVDQVLCDSVVVILVLLFIF